MEIQANKYGDEENGHSQQDEIHLLPDENVKDSVTDFETVLPQKKTKYLMYSIIKLIFDKIFSAAAILLTSPLMLMIAIAIKLDDPGPAIYKQTRVGKDKRTFTMYKFRSMHVNADARLEELKHLNEKDGPVFKITNDPRVTRVGRFIRKFSLDEFPQFFNILKGEMSIVGPRPPLVKEVEQYTPYQLRRLNVKPGLTCYWQVSGRSDLSFEEWVKMDIQYIEDRSLWVDFKIILKTIPAVLFGNGAY
ncbi:MAG: sugar transferase [Oscillospiraceae bacterium]|nr:sugar transferase [Oscillospiraceae bacterium]